MLCRRSAKIWQQRLNPSKRDMILYVKIRPMNKIREKRIIGQRKHGNNASGKKCRKQM